MKLVLLIYFALIGLGFSATPREIRIGGINTAAVPCYTAFAVTFESVDGAFPTVETLQACTYGAPCVWTVGISTGLLYSVSAQQRFQTLTNCCGTSGNVPTNGTMGMRSYMRDNVSFEYPMNLFPLGTPSYNATCGGWIRLHGFDPSVVRTHDIITIYGAGTGFLNFDIIPNGGGTFMKASLEVGESIPSIDFSPALNLTNDLWYHVTGYFSGTGDRMFQIRGSGGNLLASATQTTPMGVATTASRLTIGIQNRNGAPAGENFVTYVDYSSFVLDAKPSPVWPILP